VTAGPDGPAPRRADPGQATPGPATPGPATAVPGLALRSVTKSFGAVRAVIDGTIELHAGGAHALVGENGAGKSTMVKILAGVYRPDSVDLLIDGQPVTLHGPAAAQQAGLAVIYQEPCRRPPRPPTRTPGSGT